MERVTDSPPLVFLVAFAGQWLCAWLGAEVLSRQRQREHEAREDFRMVLASSLTLLGLLIGFSFSMAVTRYDQRKAAEAAEANAIGTAYARTELLPAAEAARVRALLGEYLEQRILFYRTRDLEQLRLINVQTTQTQGELWSSIRTVANAQPSPVVALAVSGMNDVLNSQSATQATWWNRIPAAAWGLMAVIAMLCNLMLGFAAGRLRTRAVLPILPLVVATAFYLIAEIDSPRGGFIEVTPQNLVSLVGVVHR
jgi:lipopolysaccharide export LptBFGC system permease protein LptF